jgi:chromosome segregation ATPase
MKILPKLAALFTVVMSFTVVQSAFADVSTTPSNGSTVSSAVYTTNDPTIEQIDQLYNQLLGLRQQTSALDLTMKTQHTQNEAAIKALRSNENAADIQKIKDTEALNNTIRDNNKGLLDQYKSLVQQLKQARSAKDEKTGVELKLQVSQLQVQIKAFRGQIKANDDSIKTIRQSVEASRKQFRVVLDQLKGLDQQMKPLWSEIKGYEQQKSDAWKIFNSSVNAGDANGALAALTQIVSLKGSIWNDKQKIYALQQQVATTVNASPQPTTTPAINVPASN